MAIHQNGKIQIGEWPNSKIGHSLQIWPFVGPDRLRRPSAVWNRLGRFGKDGQTIPFVDLILEVVVGVERVDRMSFVANANFFFLQQLARKDFQILFCILILIGYFQSSLIVKFSNVISHYCQHLIGQLNHHLK